MPTVLSSPFSFSYIFHIPLLSFGIELKLNASIKCWECGSSRPFPPGGYIHRKQKQKLARAEKYNRYTTETAHSAMETHGKQ